MSDFKQLIARLEEEQDDLDALQQALWPRYVAFREGLLEALEVFSSEARKRGLRGVQGPILVVEPGEDDLEITVTLNGFDLRLVAPCELLLDPTMRERLKQVSAKASAAAAQDLSPSFRIYICPDDGEESEPYAYIRVWWFAGEIYQYDIWQLTRGGGIRPIGSGSEVSKEAGARAVLELINHLYSLEHTWPPRPTLGEVRGGPESKSLGFPGVG